MSYDILECSPEKKKFFANTVNSCYKFEFMKIFTVNGLA